MIDRLRQSLQRFLSLFRRARLDQETTRRWRRTWIWPLTKIARTECQLKRRADKP